MFATYNATAPGKTLNIREAPGGAVIDKLADGKTVPVDVIERGWCKLDDGYADARFLTITAEPPADESEADDDNATAETGGSENTKRGVPTRTPTTTRRTTETPMSKTVTTTTRPPSRPLTSPTSFTR